MSQGDTGGDGKEGALNNTSQLGETMILEIEKDLPGGSLAFMSSPAVVSASGGTLFEGRRQRSLFSTAKASPHVLPPADEQLTFVKQQRQERSKALMELKQKSQAMPTYDRDGKRLPSLSSLPGHNVSTKLSEKKLHTQLTTSKAAESAARHDPSSTALWRDQVNRDPPPGANLKVR